VCEVDGSLHAFFGKDASLSRAVLASMSIAGVFAAVNIPVPGRPQSECNFVDGGTAAYIPLPDNWLTYDEVYLLVARRPLNYEPSNNNLVGRLLRNTDMMISGQIDKTIQTCNYDAFLSDGPRSA